MARVLKTHIDWLNDVMARLDELQSSVREYADEDDLVPPDKLFSDVRALLFCLRDHEFMHVPPKLRVRLSPNGDIVLVWGNENRALDLRFRAELLEPNYSLVDFDNDKVKTGNGSAKAVDLLEKIAA